MPHPSQPAASHYITNLFNAHTLPQLSICLLFLSVALHTSISPFSFQLSQVLLPAQHSLPMLLPYIIELRTHAPYTFPFNLNATFLLVKIPDNSLNFSSHILLLKLMPALILLLYSTYHPGSTIF